MTQFFLLAMSLPVVFVSLALSGIGVYKRSRAVLFISAALALPLCAYLAATPLFGLFALLFPMAILLAGALARRHPRFWGAALVAPYWVLLVWLVVTISASDENVAEGETNQHLLWQID